MKYLKFIFATLFVLSWAMCLTGQNIQSIIYQNWEVTSWNTSKKHIYEYNIDGTLIKHQTLNWNIQTDSWDTNSRVIYSLNGDQIIEGHISQNYDNQSNNWVNTQQAMHTNNNQNKPISIRFETWVSGDWTNSMLQTITYDINEFPAINLTQVWDTTLNDWVNNFQIDYTNFSDGRVQMYTTQIWDKTNSIWMDSQKATYSYNNLNKLSNIIFENYYSNQWNNSMKQISTYDGSNHLINVSNKTWDTNANDWLNSSQTIYANNNDGTISLYTSQNWDMNSNSWKNSLKATYNYVVVTQVKNLIHNNLEQPFTIYPTLCHDIMHITTDFKTEYILSILNIEGKLIREINAQANIMSLNLSNLAQGQYFIRLRNERNEVSRKFFKR